jgi:hypothetical protein
MGEVNGTPVAAKGSQFIEDNPNQVHGAISLCDRRQNASRGPGVPEFLEKGPLEVRSCFSKRHVHAKAA